MRFAVRRLLPVLAVAILAGACAANSAEPGPAASAPPAPAEQNLAGVCPATVVVQMNWFPQAEHGGLYRLLGSGFTVDAERKVVSGPLLAEGGDTGVRLEVRAGGPVTGFQRVSALMATDQSITLGAVATDEAVQEAASLPTLAVFAPMDKSPQMVMWSPEQHPDWQHISDIGRTDTTVVYSSGASYMDYLVHSGQLKQSQVDGSYDGGPARFVAEGGRIAQQGYATNEPYQYQNEITAWHRPVRFELVHDSGYPIYPEALAIRADQADTLAPCLRRLVPILQRSTAAYLREPDTTNAAIVRMVRELNAGYEYSADRAAFAVTQLRELGLANDGRTAVVGDFDPARVTTVLDALRPVLTEQGHPPAADLTADAVVSNAFIDQSIQW
ncbi:ABC transporter substrate-binding protein [Goodfellowiella coeruleoviolacea]|uniref:Nitrate ABC transporter substrate-binding protein n=1 Tax=Goodfellowiella coeruleoviolacea TaxID=334858 RepID=A0AAE3KEE7_9PSEU|nr:ABC transporter substrate-binding protein [Goodfellowiella coeruleoviolacea]MCP2163775.1 hypothetical protein [Goodfellowiella coeruleoviolacea]